MSSNNTIQNGLVSIIIPVYNCAEYLPQCLKSVLAQTYSKYEVIIINDGSTDNSQNICDHFISQHDAIFLLNTENAGPGSARNKGIRLAKGEFIFFLDADDILEKHSLEILVKAQREYNSDIVIGDFNRVSNQVVEPNCNTMLTETCSLDRHQVIEQAKNYISKPNKHLLFAYAWGRIFKTSIIIYNKISFNEDLKTFEDVAFNFEYLKYTDSIFFIKKPVYNHFIQDSLMSATMNIGDCPEQMFGYLHALKKAREYMDSKNLDMNQELGHACITLTIIQLVRICWQINNCNRGAIHTFIRKIIRDSNIRKSLNFYNPTQKESKIIPFLIKFKLVKILVIVCQYKAYKRYGKRR